MRRYRQWLAALLPAVMLVGGLGVARAATPVQISLATGQSSYADGSTVTLTGQVAPPGLAGTQVALEAEGSATGHIYWVDQVTLTSSGTFADSFVLPPTSGADTSVIIAASALGVDQTTSFAVVPPAAAVTMSSGASSISSYQTTTISGQVLDPYGHGIGGIQVNLLATAGTLSVSTVTTGAGGLFSASFKAPATPQSVTVTASVPSNSLTATTVVQVVPPGGVTISVSPDTLQAGATATVTGTATDMSGAPLPGATVQLASSAGSFAASTVVTGVDGQFSVAFTAPRAVQTATLTATIVQTGVESSAAIRVLSGPPAGISLTSNAATAGEDQVVTVSGSVYDAFMNPVTGPVEVDLSASAGTLSATTVSTGAVGTFAAQLITPAVAGPVSVSAQTSGLQSVTTIQVQGNAQASTAITVSLGRSSYSPGQSVTVAGSVYTGPNADAGAQVALEAVGATTGHVYWTGQVVTDSAGAFAAGFTLAPVGLSDTNLYVEAASDGGEGQASFSVFQPVAVAGMTWEPSPMATATDLNPGSQVPLTLTATGQGGQAAADAPVYLSFQQAPGGGSVVIGNIRLSSVPTLFFTNGTGAVSAEYEAPSSLPAAGEDKILAQNSFYAPTVQVQDVYDFGLAVATQSLPQGTAGASYNAPLQGRSGTPPYTWSVPASELPPGMSLSSGGVLSGTPTKSGNFPLTFTVADAAANTATAQLDLVIAPGTPAGILWQSPAPVAGQSTTLSGQVVDAYGDAENSVPSIAFSAKWGTVSAAATGTSGGLFTIRYTAPQITEPDRITAEAAGFSSTLVFNVQPAAAATIALTVTPLSVPAGGVAAVVGAVYDSYGNLETNPATVTLSATGASVSPAVVQTGGNGIFTASLTAGQTSGAASITAISGTATGTATWTIQAPPTAAQPGYISMTATPTAGTQGQAVELTATLDDALGAPIVDAPVVFSATGGSILALPGTTLPAMTDANGKASVMLQDTQAETDTATASADAPGGPVSTSLQVTFAPLASSSTSSTSGTASTNSLPPTPSTTTVLTSMRNGTSTEVSGQGVTLTIAAPNSATAADVVSNVTAAVYSAAESLHLLSTNPQVAIVSAVASSANAAVFVGSVVSISSASDILSTSYFNDQSTSTNSEIEISLPYNPSAVPQGSTPVVLYLNAQGVWSNTGVTILSTDPQAGTVTAIVPHLSTYTVAAVSASVATREAVQTSSATLPNDGTSSATITATVFDQNGQPMSGVPVLFSTSLGTLSGPNAVTTNASGVASVTITSTTAGTATVTAEVVGITQGNTAKVVFVAPVVAGGGGGAASSVNAPTSQTSTSVVETVDTSSSPVTVATSGDSAEVEFPEGALAGAPVVSIIQESSPPELPANTTSLSPAWQISLANESLVQSATAQFEVLQLPSSVSAAQVAIYRESGARWVFAGMASRVANGQVEFSLHSQGTYQVAVVTKTFTDVPQASQYFPAVEELIARGAASGYPEGDYEPHGNVTRAEFAKLLIGALGQAPSVAARTPFKDVPPTAWYAGYMMAAYNLGYLQGTAEGLALPEATLTREQAAAMVARAMGGTANAVTPKTDFSDETAIGSWARSAVGIDAALGVILGLPDGSFDPTGAVTRGQVALMLVRMLHILAQH